MVVMLLILLLPYWADLVMCELFSTACLGICCKSVQLDLVVVM